MGTHATGPTWERAALHTPAIWRRRLLDTQTLLEVAHPLIAESGGEDRAITVAGARRTFNAAVGVGVANQPIATVAVDQAAHTHVGAHVASA